MNGKTFEEEVDNLVASFDPSDAEIFRVGIKAGAMLLSRLILDELRNNSDRLTNVDNICDIIQDTQEYIKGKDYAAI